MGATREDVERLKISCLSLGIRIAPDVVEQLGGADALTIHEYATTGGLFFELDDRVFLNAAFDDWYCDTAVAAFVSPEPGRYAIEFEGILHPVVRTFPLPGYLGVHDDDGRPVLDVAMSHLDRIRLSPIGGCAYDCHFCDLPADRYGRREIDQVLAALRVAADDGTLPARHLLISGGTAGRRDTGWFLDLCLAVIDASPVPVDVMMSARDDGPEFVDRLVDAGVGGFAFNIELFSEDASALYIRQKHRFARPHFDAIVQRAVERLGREGAVRSLIIPGLEPVEQTIAGIEHLASLGADPVISPFRPARDTQLAHHRPTATADLAAVLAEARTIVERHGVHLGPRCLPCQHNTLTFPWDVSVPAYDDTSAGPTGLWIT